LVLKYYFNKFLIKSEKEKIIEEEKRKNPSQLMGLKRL